MGRRGRGDRPASGDEFEAEPDDRPMVSWDEPDDGRDVELLDDTWQREGGGRSPRWLLLLLVIPVVALVVFQIKPDSAPSSAPTPTSSPSTNSVTSPPKDRTGQPRTWRGGAAGHKPVVRALGHPLVPGVTGDWELFVRGSDSVIRIQPAAGRITTTAVPDFGENVGTAFVVTSAGAFTYREMGGHVHVVLDGKPARTVSPSGLRVGGVHQVVPGPDPEHMWAIGFGRDDRLVARLLDARLRPTGTVRRYPHNAARYVFPLGMTDGHGTLLATTPGGTYVVRSDGLRRVTPGAVVGAGPIRWLVVECDEVNRCTRALIDRDTGARRVVTFPVPSDGEGWGAISPDGRKMASITYSSRGPALVLTDLASGTQERLGVLASFGGGVAWSPDGRWLFFVADTEEFTAVNTRTGKSRVLHLGLDRPQEVVVRPAE